MGGSGTGWPDVEFRYFDHARSREVLPSHGYLGWHDHPCSELRYVPVLLCKRPAAYLGCRKQLNQGEGGFQFPSPYSLTNGGTSIMEFLEYFVYNIAPALSAGTGVVFEDTNFLISNYDFIFKRTIHVATSNVILKKLFNPQTGRYLFKGSDDIRHISGTSLNGLTAYGFTPYNWPVPYRVKGNNYMRASLADNSGAPNQLYMAYHGD